LRVPSRFPRFKVPSTKVPDLQTSRVPGFQCCRVTRLQEHKARGARFQFAGFDPRLQVSKVPEFQSSSKVPARQQDLFQCSRAFSRHHSPPQIETQQNLLLGIRPGGEAVLPLKEATMVPLKINGFNKCFWCI